MSGHWSHVSRNPKSTTPGFLGEIYSGEIYKVKSDPIYGPNRGPPPEMIEKALSPTASVKDGEIVDKSCWGRCKRTASCTCFVIVIIFIGLIVAIIVVSLIGARVFRPKGTLTPKEDYEKNYAFPHRTPRPPPVRAAFEDVLPTASIESPASFTTSAITSGFVTRALPATTSQST